MIRISMHRLSHSLSLIAASAAFALCLPSAARAQSAQSQLQPRITAPIDSSTRVTLPGSQPPRAHAANDIGPVPSTLQLHGLSLLFNRSSAQQAALDALVRAQQNPASPLYHRWITPDQYAAQFGVAPSDLAAAQSWLELQGFSIESISRSQNRIFFSGTAAQVASAFGAPLHYYLAPATALQPSNSNFAPSTDLSLPAALASSVLAVTGLSDFHLLPHILRSLPAAQPRFTSSQTGNHYLTPADIATIYDITPAYNSGFTGSNQSIAVIGQSAVNLTDITNFQNAVGIAAKVPIPVQVPNTGVAHIYADGDEAESDLDLEYSSTIAKGAQVYFVFTGNLSNSGVFDSLAYAVDNRIAPIISSSYGDCEPNLGQASFLQYDAYLEQAAAQGQSVLSAAGDAGSTDCYGEFTTPADNEQLAVDYPASSQYVTAVGGSKFPTADVASSNSTYFDAQGSSDIVSSAKSYIPEMVWNDDSAANGLSSGGGGVSIFTPQPSWQTGTIAGVAIPSTGHRLLPDVALTSSPANAPFAFCTSDPTFWSGTQKASCNNGLRDSSSQSLTVGGGTSFEAPIVSGLVAIINQARNSTGQGVINPTLYALAATSVYSTAFHDITSGGNQCTAGTTYCTTTGAANYPATTGYDEASGLGSLDFFNLLTAWPASGSSSSLLATSTILSAATNYPASAAADAITITVAPAATNASVPSGNVSLVVDGGTPTTLPLTAGVATYSFSSTTTGAHTLVATYSGDTLFANSSGTLTLNVGGAPSTSFGLSSNPSSPSVVAGSSASGVIVITPINGYTGTVALTAATLTNGCVVLGSSSVAVSGTTTATYTINTSSSGCTSVGAARTGSNAAARNTPQPPTPWKQLPLPATFAAGLLFLGVRRPLRSKLLSATLTLGLLLTLSLSGLALTGCGGNSASTPVVNTTPVGTYAITITGTDTKSATTSTTTITLKVT
jgi:subtilase family serine protease